MKSLAIAIGTLFLVLAGFHWNSVRQRWQRSEDLKWLAVSGSQYLDALAHLCRERGSRATEQIVTNPTSYLMGENPWGQRFLFMELGPLRIRDNAILFDRWNRVVNVALSDRTLMIVSAGPDGIFNGPSQVSSDDLTFIGVVRYEEVPVAAISPAP